MYGRTAKEKPRREPGLFRWADGRFTHTRLPVPLALRLAAGRDDLGHQVRVRRALPAGLLVLEPKNPRPQQLLNALRSQRGLVAGAKALRPGRPPVDLSGDVAVDVALGSGQLPALSLDDRLIVEAGR